MKRVICALACIALLQSCAAFDWQQCEGASGKIEDVKLSPETPSPGTTVTFSIDATVGTCFLDSSSYFLPLHFVLQRDAFLVNQQRC